MPKKSTKSRSKRKTLKQKYKIIKKTREHHRKKRKEERKAASSGKGKSKANLALKDPGIPSQWPFKEELIKEFAWKKQQILLEEKARKDERKRAREVSCCWFVF